MNRPKTPTNRMTFLQRLKYIVIQNLGNHQFGVEDLAREMGISHSQLHRNIRRQIHKTINEYIREIRLEEAMKLLKDEEYTAAEISYQVGFSSPAYFNKCFHDKYGFPPGEVKKLKQEGKLSNGVEVVDKSDLDILGKKEKPFAEKISGSRPEAKRRFSTMMIGTISVSLVIFLSAVFLLIDLWLLKPDKEVEALEKSIAVLPLRNDSPDPDNEYFCNGMMAEILDKLQNIGELNVLSRTATERYRNTTLTHKEIAKELNVNYILLGSVRKEENKFRVSVQLINAKTGFQLLSEIYEEEMDDIFTIQTDIALKTSKELMVILTTNEKQQIASTPTTDVTAYDYMLQAREEQWKYWLKGDKIALNRAEMLYNKVLKLDPEYSSGWRAKGSIYYDRHVYTEEYYEKFYLDSVIWYCDKAIASDPEYGGAYHLKGMVYHQRGNIELVSKNYEKAVVLSQNNAELCIALYRLGYLYFFKKDYINGISLIRKAVQKARDSPQDYRFLLYKLGKAYMYIGAYEVAKDYFINSRDLGCCCHYICYFDAYQGSFQASIDCISTCCQTDSSSSDCNYLLANNYLQLKEYETSVQYFQKYRHRMEELGRIQLDNLYREGFALIQMGNQEEGVELIEKQLSQLDKRKKLGRYDGYDYHYAAIYASFGDKERALQHLRNYKETVFYSDPEVMIIPISYIQHDIMFEKLWDNEEFQAIVKRDQDGKAVAVAQIREMEKRGELDL